MPSGSAKRLDSQQSKSYNLILYSLGVLVCLLNKAWIITAMIFLGLSGSSLGQIQLCKVIFSCDLQRLETAQLFANLKVLKGTKAVDPLVWLRSAVVPMCHHGRLCN